MEWGFCQEFWYARSSNIGVGANLVPKVLVLELDKVGCARFVVGQDSSALNSPESLAISSDNTPNGDGSINVERKSTRCRRARTML